ncbi:MAG: oligosaccharide repeat unit polymerase [Deltaproteobacteria bacterium]|nr:oligosaccharide repeat unit polymerase [Deltaproteobacteria bacterium]TLN01168.1 MAG: oligosaccharide repeat unit polymerase [bacterium]
MLNLITYKNNLRTLLFIPSFYGAVTWGIWLILYTAELMNLDECSILAMVIYLIVELAFVLSIYVSLPHYRNYFEITRERTNLAGADTGNSPGLAMFLLVLHLVGFMGLVLYVVEFAKNLGGISGFFLALVNEAYAIRWEAETSASVGTQLSYFGWIAISLTVYYIVRKKVSSYWLAVAVVQFLGNLLFIDRTRPLWIIFTTLLIILPAARELSLNRISRWMIFSIIAAFMLFWAVAEWTGKTGYKGIYESSVLPGITQDFYVYGVSGFAYFNQVLQSNESPTYTPERILYPLFTFLSRFGVTGAPPSQILEFYDVPFSTNVGTFLEPFYRDGGLLFVLIGILIYSFGLDLAGLFVLNSGKPLALYAWANICFTSFIGFFTPKIASFPVWLFVVLGFSVICLGYMSAGPVHRQRKIGGQ